MAVAVAEDEVAVVVEDAPVGEVALLMVDGVEVVVVSAMLFVDGIVAVVVEATALLPALGPVHMTSSEKSVSLYATQVPTGGATWGPSLHSMSSYR